MIAITLNKEINGNILLQQIDNEIKRCGSGEDKILYIEVKQITNTNNELIPKIEYKELSNEMSKSAQDDN
ncbi:MAG: hypothetical protein EBU90_26960 [Proteobacteria bacterium]|nr:hypothetical protein [Pseudomonadota bacterium]